MQAGTFNTTNDDVSKFVNSCTEATGQPNTVLYYKTYPQRGGSRGRRNYRGKSEVVIIITTTMVPNTIMTRPI